MSKNKKLELSKLELAMLKRHLRGEFFPPEQTDEENMAFSRVIDKADDLMEELDAYDELGTSLMKWYYKKYNQEQQKNAKENK